MHPRSFLFNDQVDVSGRDVELPGNSVLLGTRSNQGANLQDLRGGQLRVALFFASAGAALRGHVAQVIGLRAFKEMRRIATRLPVAGMASKESRPTFVSQKKRDAVGIITTLRNAVPSSKVAVSPYKSLGPLPAITLRAVAGSLIDMTPKAFDILRGELRWVYSNFSHFSLLDRLIRLGSFGVSRTARAACILA